MIDWSLILNQLRSSRGSLERVAREVNACPVHLRRLSRDEVHQPKFDVGVNLLDMYYDDYPSRCAGMRLL